MSKVYSGWFVWGDTVNNNVISIPGFTTIDSFEIIMSAPSATPSESLLSHISICKTSGTTSFCHTSMFSSYAPNITRLSETYCVQHYDMDSNNNTRRVISGVLVGYGTDGAGNATIEIDYDRASTAYKQYITVIGS